jgi:hypothetical protein
LGVEAGDVPFECGLEDSFVALAAADVFDDWDEAFAFNLFFNFGLSHITALTVFVIFLHHRALLLLFLYILFTPIVT